ncbi:TRAFs-binding domain-containing protein [Zavarzinella formosa]|uniref:TRAFs-binding domain-containing protein n=1 Tax=Zavarzinella formosa TaxID=360055 RepID=UPI0002DD24E8|nr:TRAFs-binding domain-containing protein [Zavarzinella formosa]
MSVEFSGRVRDELPDEIRDRLALELDILFKKFENDRTTLSLFVPRLFSGHTPEYHLKTVLAVEAAYEDGYHRHIVKIGSRQKVSPDFDGWQECTKKQMVASRIFSPVRKFELPDDRVAVVYRDAFTLFGPDDHESSEAQPKLLEEAVRWAVMDDKPDPLSAERALAHVFTDLGLWFYRGATAAPADAWKFYHSHLVKTTNDVLALWRNTPDRRMLRRHAVWVLAAMDVPNADPFSKPARYLDPVDFVAWAMADQTGKRIPNTLVGRSHGDLHARNVLVGVRRGEVQYPAVFDYGDMSAKNVLAWDFAKLETELKVRLLPEILRDETACQYLVNRSRLRKGPKIQNAIGLVSENARRADRMAAFLAFEELLNDLTKSILEGEDAERIRPLPQPPTEVQKLNRLAAILLRVRREAAKWLGFEMPRRQSLWMNELYFALGVYGLINVRWDYTLVEQEAALVSAGVALARMTSIPPLLRDSIAAGANRENSYPSYRVPLAIAYQNWTEQKYEEGCKFVEGFVIEKDPTVSGTRIRVRQEHSHAIPLIGQSLLLELEDKELHAVEVSLERLREEARTFGDSETLGRIGRVYKDSGDRKAEAEERKKAETPTSTGRLHSMRLPSLQMYDKAYMVYSEAFEATDDEYVGINAATLALMTGRPDKATDLARKVAKICAERLEYEKTERYWLFATEGEAALILGGPAEDFYEEALAELSPGQWGKADSSYRQACRLWKLLGEDRVGPVLELFETSDARECLTPNFLGRNFPKADA